MFSLSEQQLLSIWEIGLRQHPVERALTMLAVAFPEVSPDRLIALSVGQRDAYLLDIYERTFGSQLAGYANCQQCQAQLEYAFDTATIRVGTASIDAAGQALHTLIDDYELSTRLPDSSDLLAIKQCRSVAQARELLIERCILSAFRNGDTIIRGALPETVITTLAEQMVERDPQAEVLVALSCPACAHDWEAVFDIVTFLWSEILTHAKRLLRQVHTLAAAYGWRESDILAMSSVRRQFYLEIVS